MSTGNEQPSSALTNKEKEIIMKNTFFQQRNEENTIKNVGNYLAGNFDKIDGFQYKWSSLITNNPLLFEDVDYLRCKQHINNTITPEEIAAYKRGDLKDLYATFESMLVCNLQYYDRIMNFCTMIFLHYVRIGFDEVTSKHLNNVPYVFDMTPTQIYCAALSNMSSTKWELEYGWNMVGKLSESNSDKSNIQFNWDILYKDITFSRFIQYSGYRCNTSGFRETLLNDKTSNRKLSMVCSKFTNSSAALSSDQLNTIIDYVNEKERIDKKLYAAMHRCLMKMFHNDATKFSIYIYNTELFIYSVKFSIKISKNEFGQLSKEYLANSHECFMAEEYLVDSIPEQIDWSRYKMDKHHEYDQQILTTLLHQMIKENYKDIVCIKRNEYGTVSKITFKGIFDNVHIKEERIKDNTVQKDLVITKSKRNAAEYVVKRGYFIFGVSEDVYLENDVHVDNFELTKANLIRHYSSYCIPVIKHMSSVIQLYTLSKNDIIDVMCSGILNPNKINNKNIKFSRVETDINSKKFNRKLMNAMFDKQRTKSENKKTYWRAIDD